MGIDPGLSGAICTIDDKMSLKSYLMPVINGFLHGPSVCAILGSERNDVLHCYLERGQAMPGQGVSSMFKYGKICGFLEGSLESLQIPFSLVTPQKWQKIQRSQKKHPKERSLETFLQIFESNSAFPSPRYKKPHMGIVDAALIAYYGMVDSGLIVPVCSKIN